MKNSAGGLVEPFRFELVRDGGLDLASTSRVTRRAARAVVERDGRYLMIRSEKPGEGDWKFPGGGIEPGESEEEAVARELEEETGYRAARVGPLLGRATEFRTPKEAGFELFVMESTYWRVELAAEMGERRLDPYEEELDYRPRWVRLEEAIAANRELMESPAGARMPWARRETQVMELLLADAERGA
ncbi:MAG: NUDIX domain-containing protein [Spirochaetales bacterium]|nr:NUDIX domain-containing protein [Spirochaetales bacterium]